MKGFFKDFQIQIRRMMFVEIGAQFYGCSITKVPRTAITSAKLLFYPLEPSQQGDCFSAAQEQAPVLTPSALAQGLWR